MKKNLIILFAFCSVLAPGFLYAEPQTSKELIVGAKKYDGMTVEYAGELIGSVLRRGDHAWLNIKDADTAIGIWAPVVMVANIRNAGSYRAYGDVIKVTGVFNRACVQHGGGLDIHAREIILLKSGGLLREYISTKKVFALICLLGVLTCLLTIHILQKRQKSK